MAQKVFISYKYADSSVASLPDVYGMTTVRDYVDRFIDIMQFSDVVVYKGEMDGEDLSEFSNEYIWNSLKEKIYDSSLTIVFISPRMRAMDKSQEEQWIPQEVSYSLREKTRNGITSHSNALLYVLLPDKSGEIFYSLFMEWFDILKENKENGYAASTDWRSFIGNVKYYLNLANYNKQGRIPRKTI